MIRWATALVLVVLPACVTETGVSFYSPGGTSGGDQGSGGVATGGVMATGGAAVAPSGTGGATATGGGTGGVSVGGSGGASLGGTGGQSATGGQAVTGGRSGTGGRAGAGTGGRGTGGTGTGGAGTGGAASGGAGTGGRIGTGGAGTATGGAAGAPAGEVVFVGDFETGNLSQWAYVEQCASDRISVYSTANAPAGAPAPRQGQYAARFRVLDTDVAPCTSSENPRAEVETAESLFKPGDDRWEAWSVYVPSTHAQPLCGTSCAAGSFFAIQEDYGAPWDGSPSIGWFLDFSTNPHRFRMDRGAQYNHDQPGLVTMIKGRWIDFLVHKKFANSTSGGGFVEAWIDGVPVTFSGSTTTKLMMQTMHSTQASVGFYLTAYRARGLFATFDIFYDAVRIGTTRAAVELK